MAGQGLEPCHPTMPTLDISCTHAVPAALLKGVAFLIVD